MREDEHPDFMGFVNVIDEQPEHDDPTGGWERHALIYVSPGGSVALTYYECCHALWRTDDGRNLGGALWGNSYRLSREGCETARSKRSEVR